jgi:hypothetical protein
MKGGSELNAAILADRMKPLPRPHRLAHLRASIRRQPAGSIRRDQLAAVLGNEIMAQSCCEDGVV